jgi:LmbE family N-acetylglucosaminyl deacetylase
MCAERIRTRHVVRSVAQFVGFLPKSSRVDNEVDTVRKGDFAHRFRLFSSRSGPAIFLSPHWDDAIFSASGLMLRERAKGRRVFLVTVFGGFPPAKLPPPAQVWFERCGLTSGQEGFAQWSRENMAAADVLGVTVRDWVIPQISFVPEVLTCLADAINIAPDPDRVYQVLAHLRAIDEELTPSVIYIPWGLGKHVDHLTVHEAARAFRSSRMLCWMDYPYLSWADEQEWPSHVSWINLTAKEVDLKLQASLCYNSQWHGLFGLQDPAETRQHIWNSLRREWFCRLEPR